MSRACEDCGGSCCSAYRMNACFAYIASNDTLAAYLLRTNLRDLLRADGSVPEMRFWLVKEPGEGLHGDLLLYHCAHLSEAGRCTIYETRPRRCREWECAVLGGFIPLAAYKGLLAFTAPRLVHDKGAREVTVEVLAALRRQASEPIAGDMKV